MWLSYIPLLYQLLQAYHPATNLPQVTSPSQVLGTTTSVTSPTPTPTPTLPPIGGEGKIVTIAVLGDSMIDTLGKDIPQLAPSLNKYFPDIKFQILNYGYGGDHIEAGLYRLTHDYQYQGRTFPSLISQKPDIIIIESFAYNNYGNSQSGIDRQWLALGAITTTIQKELPDTKIVLAATIAPNSVVFGNGIAGFHPSALDKIEKTTTIKLYLQNLVNFATSQHFPLADTYHPSLVNGDGLLDFINSQDHLHPSGAGGEFFCDTIAKAIFDNKLIDK